MATLEKIRSKSVLLVVIIALALLAFILGDAITNGRNLFGNNTTVAKVGKEKIEIQEYQQKQQEINALMEEARRQNPQQYDSQVLPQQVIDQLISEKLANSAVEAIGYQASPEMLRFFMIENSQSILPEMQNLLKSMNQSGLSVTTPEQAHLVIFQPQNFGLSPRQVEPFQRAWVAMEALAAQRIGQVVYSNLLSNTFKANDLDIAAMRRDYAATASLKVAKKPYGELDEKTYPVSDDEIKKAYESRKEEYRVAEPTKEVGFIVVNIPPSGKDMQEATALATQVVAELQGGEVSKETRKNGLDVRRHEMRMDDVRDINLKNFLQSAPFDSVSIVTSNNRGFTVAKVTGRETKVDSLELSAIQVMGSPALIASVLEYANSGQPLDSINTKFSADSVAYMAPTWQALYNAEGKIALGLPQETMDSLMNSNGRYMIAAQQEGAANLLTVNQKSAPKSIVEYETVSYELHPSDATLSEARAKLQKYINENNTAQKFVANAAAAGYNVVDVPVSASTPALPMGPNNYYPDSRAVVRWIVIDGKDGEVSKIYQSKDAASPNLYVAAVLDSFEEYIPWNNKNVKEELTAQVRRNKAGDALVKQYSKGTLEASAQAMGVEPVEVASLQSSKYDMTVTDGKVKGRILGSKASDKVQVVKGDDGVYAFVITEVGQEPVQMTDEQFAEMFLRQHQLNIPLVLRGNKKIENNVYKFEQAE